MFFAPLAYTTARKEVTTTNPANVCQSLKAVTIAGVRRRDRPHGAARSHRRKAEYAATVEPSQSSPRTKTARGPNVDDGFVPNVDDGFVPNLHDGFVPNLHDGFVLVPFPSKILTVRPTISERLEKSDVTPTIAQRHNIELGKASIEKHGSGELAVRALIAAHTKRSLRVHEVLQSARRAKRHASKEHRDDRVISHALGYELSFAHRKVGIREAAFTEARGVEKLKALHLLKKSSSWATALEFVYPFRQHVLLQKQLILCLRNSPLKRLQEFGIQGLALNKELASMVTSLRSMKQDANATSELERVYNLTKGITFEAFSGFTSSLDAFWTQQVILIHSTRSHRSTVHQLHEPLKIFSAQLLKFNETCFRAIPVISTIMLRRQSLQGSQPQNIFNALHHHIKSMHHGIQYYYRRSRRDIENLCRQAILFRGERRNRSKTPIMFHEQSIIEALDKVEHGMSEILQIYYDEFLPLWLAGIKLMSPDELARQDCIARRYWISCLKSDKKKERRLRELQKLYNRLHSERGRVKNSPSHCNEQSAHMAIARLAQLHAIQVQENANRSGRSSCEVLTQDRGTTSSSEPAVSNARKTVMWQPKKRFTVTIAQKAVLEQPMGLPAASAAIKTVLWQPKGSFAVRNQSMGSRT